MLCFWSIRTVNRNDQKRLYKPYLMMAIAVVSCIGDAVAWYRMQMFPVSNEKANSLLSDQVHYIFFCDLYSDTI